MLCSHLRGRPNLEPDRLRRKLYRKSVRIMSATHPHTGFTDEPVPKRHSQQECRLRGCCLGKPSARRRSRLRTGLLVAVTLDGNPGLTSLDPLGCSAGRRQSIPLEAPCHARVLSVPSTIYALRSALAPLLTLEAAMRDLAVEAYSQGNLAFK